MPTYQYSCTECGHFFETVQSFTEDSLTECPACSGRLRKVFNAVGVVFKGSGFYRNDSRGTSASSDPAHAHASAGTGSNGSNGSSTASNGSDSSSSSTSTGTPSKAGAPA